MVAWATIAGDASSGAATASRGAMSSFHDHHQAGASASRPLRHVRVIPSNSDWLMLSSLHQSIGGCRVYSHGIRHQLRRGASVAAARLFIPYGLDGANRPSPHAFPYQLPEYPAGSVVPHRLRLSKSSSSDGSTSIGKDLTIETQSLPPRGKIYD